MSSAGISSQNLLGGGTAAFVPPTPRRRYASPPPSLGKPRKGKSFASPPPPPRHHYARRGSLGTSAGELAAESVQTEINAGKSILNPRPVHMAGIRKSLREEFVRAHLSRSTTPARNVRPRLGDGGLVLVSPAYPRFPSLPPPSSAGDVSEDDEVEDEDMPRPPPTPIRLPMRSTCQPMPPRVSFVPIRPEEEDDGED